MLKRYKTLQEKQLKEYLIDQNYKQHKTTQEIAEYLGCSKATVIRIFKKYNIKIVSNAEYFSPKKYGYNTIEDLKNKLIEYHYNEKMTQNQIAKLLNCRRQTVIDMFKRLDIPTIRYNSLHEKCGFATDAEMAVELTRLYHNKNLSKKQIAEMFKINQISISTLFKKYNIPSRDQSQCLKLTIQDLTPTQLELDIINGLLLGKGTISLKKYTASLIYYSKYEEIVKGLCQNFKRFNPKYYNKKSNFKFNTSAYPYFTKLKKIWFGDKDTIGTAKHIPDIELNSETCYWLYIGNGYVSNNTIGICMNDIDIDDVNILIQKLPVESKLWMKKRSKKSRGTRDHYPIILINKISERQKFLRFIGPCRHQCLAYKWQVLNNKGENLGY